MPEFIYKILRAAERNELAAGVFAGSADDKRDGYLHFSSAGQLKATYDKYYSAENDAMLVIVESARLGNALKWEVSRGGEKFPHLYGVLRLSDVRAVIPILRDGTGTPLFPPEIP